MTSNAAALPTAATPPRGRRAVRTSGDERQRAILETAERLLETKPLSAISTDELARGAGISRPTFYFYFASKDAVLLQLLDRMIAEVEERLDAVPGDAATSPAGWWRAVLAVFVDVFTSHRAVSTTVAAARDSGVELAALWSASLARWIAQTAAVIASEQRRGAALATVDPEPVAIALNAMNERVLSATLAGEQPSVAEDRVLDLLTSIWLTTIYGTPDP